MIHHRLRTGIVITLLLLRAATVEGQLWNKWGGTNNIIQVAKNGAAFHSIQAALDSITDATEDNPYLVYVAPGVYEEQIDMKPFVDIEGAGEALTKIVSGRDYAISGSSHAELRSLTLEGAASCERVLWVGSGQSASVSDVTIRASGHEPRGIEIWYAGPTYLKHVTIEIAPTSGWGSGIRIARSTAVLDGVTLLATSDERGSYGIVAFSAESVLEVRNSIIVADGPGSQGILGYGLTGLQRTSVLGEACAITVGTLGSMTVRSSEIRGGICNYGVASLLHSQLDGAVAGATTPSCFSVHDADVKPLDGDCRSPSD